MRKVACSRVAAVFGKVVLLMFANRAQVHLWQSPKMTALHDRVLPSRLKELVGVFHAKVHVFDDTVILSGANLSESYFRDRKGLRLKKYVVCCMVLFLFRSLLRDS